MAKIGDGGNHAFRWVLLAFVLFVPGIVFYFASPSKPKMPDDPKAVYKTAAEIRKGFVQYGSKVYSLQDDKDALFDDELSNNEKLVCYLQKQGEPIGVTLTFPNYGKGFRVDAGIVLTLTKGEPQQLEWLKDDPRK